MVLEEARDVFIRHGTDNRRGRARVHSADTPRLAVSSGEDGDLVKDGRRLGEVVIINKG